MKAYSIGHCWSLCLLNYLKALGVTRVCIAPGSRSTCLVKAAHTVFRDTLVTHFDERALAFYALGCAKATCLPTVVITTSGSAVANLLPALTEAHTLRIPLFVITADRPPELHHCGANQTIAQEPLLRAACTTQLSSPVPTECPLETASFLQNLTDHTAAFFEGPTHLNMVFREPFLESTTRDFSPLIPSWWLMAPLTPTAPPQPRRLPALSISEKTLVILSVTARPLSQTDILDWAQKTQVPVYAECTSSMPWHDQLLHAHDSLWETLQAHPPDHVICLGAKWLDKRVHALLKHVPKLTLVHDFTHTQNWLGRPASEHIVPLGCISATLPSGQNDPSYLHLLHQAALSAPTHPPYTSLEDQALYSLQPHLHRYDHLFVGNSLAIRSLNRCLPVSPNNTALTLHTQRGLSGIDGLLSTAIGVAHSVAPQKTAIILGDTSFLYDSSALYFLKQHPIDLSIIILNNNGGRIFEALPISQDPSCTPLFVMPHDIPLASLVTSYSCTYRSISHPTTLSDQDLKDIAALSGPVILDITLLTPPKKNDSVAEAL